MVSTGEYEREIKEENIAREIIADAIPSLSSRDYMYN